MDCTTEDRNGVLVFTLNGALHAHAGGYEFLDALRGKIASGTRRIVIDMAGVDRADSGGIGVLAAAITSAQNAKANLRFAGITARVWNVLSVVYLARAIQSYPTVEEAVTSLRAT